jgi:hypothetical protein
MNGRACLPSKFQSLCLSCIGNLSFYQNEHPQIAPVDKETEVDLRTDDVVLQSALKDTMRVEFTDRPTTSRDDMGIAVVKGFQSSLEYFFIFP